MYWIVKCEDSTERIDADNYEMDSVRTVFFHMDGTTTKLATDKILSISWLPHKDATDRPPFTIYRKGDEVEAN